ncbi:MAG: exo-alpha-sialidase [Clostridia bacterium]|nr:exo-alpha-sialidase [Clostridia bacterium]
MKIIGKSVFEGASDYKRARIPGIICTDKGTVLAYCELRQSDSDWAVIDIGMKKSTDGGKSWSQRKILVSGENENTVNNPVMIADGDTVHFLYCVNYHRVFYMKSTDEGESWTAPAELTDAIKEQTKNFFWSCIATGPTHGIRLSTGRLLVPVWLAYNREDEKSHHPSVIALLYSDDRGESWKIGEIYKGLHDASEFTVAQLFNGKIIVSIRHEEENRCRVVAEVSEDAEIIDPVFCEELPDPVCCAGMCSLGENILFVNCADTEHRINLTLRKTEKGTVIKESLLLSEVAGYSDIAVSPDKKYAYILYEHERTLVNLTVEIN